LLKTPQDNVNYMPNITRCVKNNPSQGQEFENENFMFFTYSNVTPVMIILNQKHHYLCIEINLKKYLFARCLNSESAVGVKIQKFSSTSEASATPPA